MQKVTFLGAVRRSGVSKAGKNYDMFNMSFITPVQNGDFGNMKVDGFGYESREMELEEGCFFNLKKAAIKPLSELYVDVQMDINNPRRSMITDFKQPEAK